MIEFVKKSTRYLVIWDTDRVHLVLGELVNDSGNLWYFRDCSPNNGVWMSHQLIEIGNKLRELNAS